MDLRSLSCVVALAEDLHFRRAAERLHLTQPALSQRIRALEQEIGTPLFCQDRRGVSLTPAGVAFLGPARQAVALAERARGDALAAAGGEGGRLRLGVTVIAFYGSLPEAVQQFRLRFPAVEVELAEMNSPSLERALAAGELDLGVLHPPLETASLCAAALPDEPFRLALPATHPLADQDVVPIQALDGMPFLIAPRRIGPSIYDRVIAMFQREGVSPHIVQEATPMTALVGLVAAGVGMGFVTAGVARAARPGVAFRPVSPELPSLPLAAAWRRPTPHPTARRFMEVVSAVQQESGSRLARRSPLSFSPVPRGHGVVTARGR